MIAEKQQFRHSQLLMLGTFMIAFNVSIACHETGHLVSFLIDGVGIKEFHLNPFSWSWAFPRTLNNPIFTGLGGVSFGLIFSLIPLLIYRGFRIRSLRLPALVIAAMAFSINGIYLLVGFFAGIGDGGELKGFGLHPLLIILLGGAYILLAIGTFLLFQPLIGIGKKVSFINRCRILLGGTLPYLIVMVLYNILFNPKEWLLWLGFAVAGTLLMTCVSLMSPFLYRMFPKIGATSPCTPKPSEITRYLIVGISIIFAELILFGIRDNPFIRGG